MFRFRVILWIIPFLIRIPGFGMDEPVPEDSPGLAPRARWRLKKELEKPILSFWRKLEPLRPEGRYIRQYRIKEMKEELENRPAFLPFEKTFSGEMKPDERIVQSRDALLEREGYINSIFSEYRQKERKRYLESDSPVPLSPRRRLHDYLARRILRFWLRKEESALDEYIRFQDLREDLFDQGQDETPDEFHERRVRDKRRLSRVEPLKPYRLRLFRDLVDTRTKNLIERWRERGAAFSRPRK